jgi:branched-chain amino acid transport system permease protein
MSKLIGYRSSSKIRPFELLPWVLAIVAFFALPEYLSLGAQILTFILFALSLDLITGYAGIVTLGHAAFFGVGAYTCGVLSAKFGIKDPILLLLLSAAMCSLLGFLTGLVILRTQKMTQLMLTLAIAALCFEIANKATPLTGGADGLTGVSIAPIFGVFNFDFLNKTAYLWCLSILFLAWFLVRRMIYSPFGIALVGIKENKQRMQAIGVPVMSYLLKAYTFAAMLAGIAGALITQTNQFVGLNVIGFEPSGEILVMLILGGVGRMYGAFIGPLVFIVAQDYLAKQFPEYWNLGIGVMLMVVVLFAKGGLLGIWARLLGSKGRKS